MEFAAFGTDGRRVVTGSRDKTALVWDIAPDNRPVEDWLALVRLMAGHEIDNTGGLQPLTRERLQDMWQSLRAKYPRDFTVSSAQARSWREEQIGQCLQEGNLNAAFFHRDWLIAEMVTGK